MFFLPSVPNYEYYTFLVRKGMTTSAYCSNSRYIFFAPTVLQIVLGRVDWRSGRAGGTLGLNTTGYKSEKKLKIAEDTTELKVNKGVVSAPLTCQSESINIYLNFS